MQVLRFSVPGDPRSSSQPRVTSRGTYMDPKSKAYQEHVRECAMVEAAKRDSAWRADGREYHLVIHFFKATARRVDFDNLSKNVCDALNKLLWPDDSLVTKATITIALDRTNPRAEVEVTVLG